MAEWRRAKLHSDANLDDASKTRALLYDETTKTYKEPPTLSQLRTAEGYDTAMEYMGYARYALGI